MKNDFKKISRVFGFNKGREGLITRYLNEAMHWKSHIEHTKDYILSSSKNKEKKCCMILGSGWWLDLPIDELHELFNELILVDITHSNQIKRKAEKYSKVKLVTADISGVLELLQKKDKYEIKDILHDTMTANRLDILNMKEVDFVVSLNILSQISYFPTKYVLRKKKMNEFDTEKLGEYIEKNHLEILPKNKSCIITDYYQYEYDSDNILLSEEKSLKVSLPLNKTLKEWDWDFDMSGNYINNRKVKFKVAALQV